MFVVACSDKGEKPKAQLVAPASQPAAGGPASQPAAKSPLGSPKIPSSGSTGAVSEEAFKALHELRGDAAIPTRGIVVEVAGSRAYLSLPPGAEPPVAGLVVIHEWWGLNDHIRRASDRLAAQGYAALAVDLYDGQVATTRDDAMKFMKGVDDSAAKKILDGAHAFLAEDARIKATKRGVIGWCFGGGWSLRHALATPDLNAAVVFYGHVSTDAETLAPLQADLLGLFGTKDEAIPNTQVDAFEAALKSAGKTATILRFDAEHAFANPSSARYDPVAAAAAFSEVQAFLGARLGWPK